MFEEDYIDLGKVKPNKPKEQKNVARIHANSLFKFMDKLNYLQDIVTKGRILPRYVIEPVDYLRLGKIKNIAYPMICFCDINMHNLDKHIDRYGGYGIALSKDWGKKNRIQPIQYINPQSELRKDYTEVFKNAIKHIEEKHTRLEEKYEDFILHELMYYKPYEGKDKRKKTCFADECEWRYIEKVSRYGFQQIITDSKFKISEEGLKEISDFFSEIKGVGLEFEYSDVKYLIVKENNDLEKIVETIDSLDILDLTKKELISKIIVWDNCKEDF